jgi:hypothetical protein
LARRPSAALRPSWRRLPLCTSGRCIWGIWIRLRGLAGDFGKASAMVHYQLTNQRGEQVAEATQRGLFVRIADGRPVRLGEELAVRFAPYVRTDACSGAGSIRRTGANIAFALGRRRCRH